VEPRDAATVMLVRDAPELEVFMLRRNLRSGFVAGAYVFPGGAVDDDDADPELLARVDGLDAASADARLDAGPRALRFWVAAIRESFEEAGVLLARHAGSRDPVDVSARDTAAMLDEDRRALIAGDRTFLDIVRARDLVLDVGALEVFSRWITPAGAPRRYDTWFFVAPAPAGHAYVHDDDETVASAWVRPGDALELARRDEIQLIFPTYRSLQVISRYTTAADLLRDVRRAPLDLQVVQPAHGWMLDLEGTDDRASVEDALAHATASGRRATGTR
jgi:8-oxo-dGTP pyrophosphatase MutT (NUDIX family)